MICCGLTKYGRREWLTLSAILATHIVIFSVLAAGGAWWLAIAAVPVAIVWGWVLWFFRDPERSTTDTTGAFISPADGRVAEITPVGPEGPLGRDGVRIGVFMNIFSVHVNRSPCDGRVEKAEHHAGAFLDARLPEAAWKNEHATLFLTHRRHGVDWPIVVRQVAGKVARRIVTAVKPGQELRRGERFGMIKFGSYLELTVPRELAGEVRVKLGEQVYAGRTVLIECADGGRA